MRKIKFYSRIAMGMVLLISCCILACHPSPPIPNVPSSQQPPSTEQPVKRPAEFEISSLTVAPSPLVAGGSATVSANVQNTGDEGGLYVAILSLDDQAIDKKEVNLVPQQSSTVEFTVDELTTGKHAISIGESKVSMDVLPKPTKIAFVRDFGPYYKWEICTMDSDGTNIKNITNSSSLDLHPTWSPDNTKIAFESIREWFALSSIYVMDIDGSNVKCLTPEVKSCRFPVWSPDGKQIAYCVMKRLYGEPPASPQVGFGTSSISGLAIGENFIPNDIFIMNADGSDKVLITNGWGASWFPDSQRIAFVDNTMGVWNICSINVDGTGRKTYFTIMRLNQAMRLPDCKFPMVAVSPNGSQIAFEYPSGVPGGKQDIYIIELDSKKTINITRECKGDSYCPTWSSDGTKIMFTLVTEQPFLTSNGLCIYTVNTDGTNVTKLIENGHWGVWQR